MTAWGPSFPCSFKQHEGTMTNAGTLGPELQRAAVRQITLQSGHHRNSPLFRKIRLYISLCTRRLSQHKKDTFHQDKGYFLSIPVEEYKVIQCCSRTQCSVHCWFVLYSTIYRDVYRNTGKQPVCIQCTGRVLFLPLSGAYTHQLYKTLRFLSPPGKFGWWVWLYSVINIFKPERNVSE